MISEEQLKKDLEEFKIQFPNYPNPEHYPIQFAHLIKLFYFYKRRKEHHDQ